MSQPDMTGSFAATPSPLPTPRPSQVSKLRRAGLFTTAGLTLAAGAAAWQGYRYLHQAPGQEAMESLMPREALGACSVDFKPRSIEQVQVMRRIGSSLQDEGLTEQIRDEWEKSFKDTPLLRELRPYVEQSGAFAVWSGPATKSSDYRFIAVSSVTSPEQVAPIIAKLALSTSEWNGTKITAVSSASAEPNPSTTPDTYIAILGHYLVASPTREAVTDVIDVWQHKHDSLLQAPEYTALRATLPDDANIVGYISPSAPRAILQQQSNVLDMPTNKASLDSLKSFKGGMYSMSLRAKGIYFGSTAEASGEQFAALRNVARLDPKTSLRVPKGAIGVVAWAQPGAYYDAAETVLRDAPAEERKQWDDSKKSFEKETGLSIANDVRPALNGDAVVAFYPGQKDLPVNVVGMLTDARGAQPAALLQRTQGVIQGKEPSARFASRQEGKATYWEMPSAAAEKNGISIFKPLQTASGDTTLYAQVGQTALAGSSRTLLEDAVKTYEGGDAFTTTAPVPQDAQMLMVIRPQALIDVVLANAPTALSGSSVTKDDLYKLWGSGDIMASGSYNGSTMKGSVFVPLQYEEITKLLARFAKEQKQAELKNVTHADAAL